MVQAILKVVAAAGKKMAHKASGSASYFGYHQPKEPKALQEAKK